MHFYPLSIDSFAYFKGGICLYTYDFCFELNEIRASAAHSNQIHLLRVLHCCQIPLQFNIKQMPNHAFICHFLPLRGTATPIPVWCHCIIHRSMAAPINRYGINRQSAQIIHTAQIHQSSSHIHRPIFTQTLCRTICHYTRMYARPLMTLPIRIYGWVLIISQSNHSKKGRFAKDN